MLCATVAVAVSRQSAGPLWPPLRHGPPRQRVVRPRSTHVAQVGLDPTRLLARLCGPATITTSPGHVVPPHSASPTTSRTSPPRPTSPRSLPTLPHVVLQAPSPLTPCDASPHVLWALVRRRRAASCPHLSPAAQHHPNAPQVAPQAAPHHPTCPSSRARPSNHDTTVHDLNAVAIWACCVRPAVGATSPRLAVQCSRTSPTHGPSGPHHHGVRPHFGPAPALPRCAALLWLPSPRCVAPMQPPHTSAHQSSCLFYISSSCMYWN
jgi:hypothetical protein